MRVEQVWDIQYRFRKNLIQSNPNDWLWLMFEFFFKLFSQFCLLAQASSCFSQVSAYFFPQMMRGNYPSGFAFMQNFFHALSQLQVFVHLSYFLAYALVLIKYKYLLHLNLKLSEITELMKFLITQSVVSVVTWPLQKSVILFGFVH